MQETMIPHLVVGSDEKSIDNYLQDFIKKNKISANFIFKIYPANKEFSINQIREIRRQLMIDAGTQRLFVLYDFATASGEAQNAFLKTLEERSEDNYFLLICQSLGHILPTIISRAKIHKLESKKKPSDEGALKLISYFEKILTANDYSFLADFWGKEEIYKEPDQLISEMLAFFRAKLKSGDAMAAIVLKEILRVKNLIVSNNVNPRLVLDNLLIFIFKTYSMKHGARSA